MKLEIRMLQRDDDREKAYGIYTDVIDVADTYWGDSESSIGEIFGNIQKEYGRCTGKVFVDTKAKHIGWGQVKPSAVKQVGWVFEKRENFDQSRETYLQETWVTLLEVDETTRTIRHHYIA